MKKVLLPVLLFMFFFGAIAQPKAELFRFEHTGSRAAIIKQGKFSQAKVLADLVPYFPSKNLKNRIVYHKVTLVTINNGAEVTARGLTNELTVEQTSLLNNTAVGSEVMIRVEYSYKDSDDEYIVTSREAKEIEFAVTPGPDSEAEFPGGKEAMEQYLKTNIIEMVPEKVMEEKIAKATIHYTVDEEGKILAPTIYKTTLDPELDKMLIDAIKKMPAWKPAQNNKGEKVKQDFIVNVCNIKGGC